MNPSSPTPRRVLEATATPAQALRLATVGGAAVLNRPELGRVEIGAAADLVCFRRDDIAFAGAVEQDPLGALLLFHAGPPEHVFIQGRQVVRDGQVTGIDLPKAIEQFNELVRRKWT
jgi:8-oxoguanine deaminase